MRVFIAGATGVLGRRVVQRLIANGHQVVGLSRSARNRDWLRQQGAVPREGDLFNREELNHISADCEATLHLATAMPTKTRTNSQDWALNDRIRREGTENLVAAALRNQHKFYLQQSITLIYGDQGGDWVDETVSLPKKQVDILDSAVDMEHIVRQAENEGLAATILRFGTFYSHDSAHTQGMFQTVKKGFFPKMMLGASLVDALLASVRCRNGRFKEVTGWIPEYPTYRTGIVAEVEKWLAQASASGSPANLAQPTS
jgi:nucleoside-diphosphate-sugar epimerase